jgi:hypothetical protein
MFYAHGGIKIEINNTKPFPKYLVTEDFIKESNRSKKKSNRK